MNEFNTWYPFLFPIVFIVVICIAIAFSLKRYTGTKTLMQHQAAKRNGTAEGSFVQPHLRFYHRDLLVTATTRMGSRYQPPETRFSVGVTLSQPRNFSVYRETVASRVGKKLGTPDLQLGIDEFDSKFMIKSDDEFYMRSLLDFAVQNKLLEVHHFHPFVQLTGNTLTVRVPRILASDEDYDKLIDATLAIVDRIIDMH